MPVIGGRIDHPQTAPELAFYAVFVKHGVPADAIVRRLDQRKRKVAQSALIVGEIVQRDGSTGTYRRLLADPGVDVVGNERRLEPAEVADAGAAAKHQKNENSQGRLVFQERLGVGREARGGIGCGRSAASQPSTTAIFRRWRTVRFGISGKRRVVPFNANHRENDDGGGLFRRVHTAEAHDAPFIRELDNGAHVGGPSPLSAAPQRTPCPDAPRIGLRL
jgi:hypothetical protein